MGTSLSSFQGQRVLITGAGSGIGRAIARHLAAVGARLCVVGRTASALESLCEELRSLPTTVHAVVCDLDQDDDVRRIRHHVEGNFGGLDILVHSAGVIAMESLDEVSLAEFDRHYRINVRAPLLLTQVLLPLLRATRGQIVFVNSSLALRTKERAGAYAASKHALKALADTLRMEVNAAGVRVLSVFPGNTATPMQARICRSLGQTYRPEQMLQPDDIAVAVRDALALPPTAELTDLHIRPARKPDS
ncbi:MAG: SDR family oxidoreductase [Sulfurifustaceae bacterium]